MSSFVGEKIRDLRESKDLTQEDLARLAGLTKDHISKIERGESKHPRTQTIEALAVALDVPPQELLYGDLPSPKEWKNKLSEDFSDIPHLNKIRGRPVPVLGSAACGKWEDFSDLNYIPKHAEEWVFGMTNDPQAFFVRAKGESMVGDGISTGDFLLVEPHTELTNGCRVLAQDNHACTVKRYYQEGNKIRLQPMNPDFPPIYLDINQDFRIYRIVSVTKKL